MNAIKIIILLFLQLNCLAQNQYFNKEIVIEFTEEDDYYIHQQDVYTYSRLDLYMKYKSTPKHKQKRVDTIQYISNNSIPDKVIQKLYYENDFWGYDLYIKESTIPTNTPVITASNINIFTPKGLRELDNIYIKASTKSYKVSYSIGFEKIDKLYYKDGNYSYSYEDIRYGFSPNIDNKFYRDGDMDYFKTNKEYPTASNVTIKSPLGYRQIACKTVFYYPSQGNNHIIFQPKIGVLQRNYPCQHFVTTHINGIPTEEFFEQICMEEESSEEEDENEYN